MPFEIFGHEVQWYEALGAFGVAFVAIVIAIALFSPEDGRGGDG